MSRLEPWIIEQLENEARRREEEQASRRHRIELPQTGSVPSEPTERSGALGRLEIVPVSPTEDAFAVLVIDL